MAVKVNGTCYITDEKPSFPFDLTETEVVTDSGTTLFVNPKIIECASGFEPGYWFTLVEKSSVEVQEEELAQQRADIDYISAMAEIDL